MPMYRPPQHPWADTLRVRSEFQHARFEDGIPLMVDMIPKQTAVGVGGNLGSKGATGEQKKVRRFFRDGVGNIGTLAL